MNELLKELMIQADYPAPEITKRAHVLAELIVLKCAEIADTAEPFLASDLIKQHFGIKS
jgi:hypothetical protein